MSRGIEDDSEVGPVLPLGQLPPARYGEPHRLLQGGLAFLLGVPAVVITAGRGDLHVEVDHLLLAVGFLGPRWPLVPLDLLE